MQKYTPANIPRNCPYIAWWTSDFRKNKDPNATYGPGVPFTDVD